MLFGHDGSIVKRLVIAAFAAALVLAGCEGAREPEVTSTLVNQGVRLSLRPRASGTLAVVIRSTQQSVVLSDWGALYDFIVVAPLGDTLVPVVNYIGMSPPREPVTLQAGDSIMHIVDLACLEEHWGNAAERRSPLECASRFALKPGTTYRVTAEYREVRRPDAPQQKTRDPDLTSGTVSIRIPESGDDRDRRGE